MKYKFRQVGIKRHPELYKGKEPLTHPVFTTVKQELKMWKTAEKINRILKGFTLEQMYFIWHYVNCLKGLNNLEELAMFEWIKFRLYLARIFDVLENQELRKKIRG